MYLRLAQLLSLLAALVAGSLAPARAADSTPNAREIADRMQSRFDRLHDYRCEMDLEVHGEHGSKRGVYRLWFLQPDRIRLKVLHGDDKGSELATTADGRARGRAGGVIHFVPAITMSKTDERLRSPSGHFGWECDFGTYARWLRERLALTPHPQVSKGPNGEVRLVLEYPDPVRHRPLREEWRVDAADGLPVSVTTTEKGDPGKDKLLEQVRFRSFQADTGLTLRDMDLR